MKALSLWQPHVAAIALGLKPWETRDWPMRHRGPLAIHAAKRPWNDIGPWHEDARLRLWRRMDETTHTRMEFGAVICVVDVVDCVRTSELRGVIPEDHEFWGDFSDGDSGAGRWAFALRHVRVLPRPVPLRGMQGLFDVELDGFGGVGTGTLPLFGN